MVTKARLDEIRTVEAAVRTWAAGDDAILGASLVGSCARGEARMDSDVDVVVLTDSPQRFIDRTDWVVDVCGPATELVRTKDWGALTELRVRLASGLEVEFGFAEPSWAATDPIDAGTMHVVEGGCIPWHDPASLFAALIDAVRSRGV